MTTATRIFDPEFKYVKEVPNSVVRHTPPSRLNITRLVFCRNYRPYEPSSCTMGSNCKFVHADIDPETLPSHPIHVNYVWRHESLCTYERLPPGAVLQIAVDGGVEDIASDRVLLTRGSLRACDYGTDLHKAHVQCEQYVNERMCNRGSECDAVHVVVVDATVEGDFRRARAPRSSASRVAARFAGVSTKARTSTPTTVAASVGSDEWSCAHQASAVLELTPRCGEGRLKASESRNDVAHCACGACSRKASRPSVDASLIALLGSSCPTNRRYSHNPYRPAAGVKVWMS